MLEPAHPEYPALSARLPELPGMRAVIRLRVTRIADSCGWTVPLYEFAGTRDYYQNYVEKLGSEGLRKAQLAVNVESIDGLPGLERSALDP